MPPETLGTVAEWAQVLIAFAGLCISYAAYRRDAGSKEKRPRKHSPKHMRDHP